ncbi:MAG: glycoside hydrolase family 43 protein [Opitutaceae bacterium]
MKSFRRWPLALLPLAVCLTSARAVQPAVGYLFTYFTKNGEDGLHLAWSSDGYRWEKLNNGQSYLEPKVGQSKLMRDPCVVRGPDGTYHLVWTSGWNENNIGYASTKDFLTWTEQKEIPVMAHEPTVRNSWAPEIHYDETRKEFILFWASTIPGKFTETAGTSETAYNHRLYFTTTKDFAAFAPTKVFYDPKFSVIDATFLKTDNGTFLIVKDETVSPPKKYLQIARAPDLQGPFESLAQPFTPKGVWVEGPTATKVGEDYIVYYDAYIEEHYGALRSRDLKNWEEVTAKMTFPDEGTPVRMRHGTVIAVTPDVISTLLKASAR